MPCGACLASPPPFIAARAAFAYAFPVDRLLQRLKYHGALALADWAAQALAAEISGLEEPAFPNRIVIALPLAPARQRERGFNQAHEIARRVAAALDLRVVAALERVKGGPPQAALPWKGRARNVRGAFACRLAVAGRHCILVDDVMTTGATLREATRTLLDAGAASVEVWVVARTLPPDEA
jgi:ComF family protein